MNWRDQAACKGATAIFFLERSDPNVSRVASQTAKAVCASCPVSSECLREALLNRETFGVWGGLSPKERQKFANRVPIPDAVCARCGTVFRPYRRGVRYCTEVCRERERADQQHAYKRSRRDPYAPEYRRLESEGRRAG